MIQGQFTRGTERSWLGTAETGSFFTSRLIIDAYFNCIVLTL